VNKEVICSAMKKRGITKWDSPEGIELCLHCPLSECELDNDEIGVYEVTERRKTAIQQCISLGLDVNQISERTGLSRRTVHRYIRKEEAGGNR